jgi:hypothetical protein
VKRRRAIATDPGEARAKPLREDCVCAPLHGEPSAPAETPLPFDGTDERFIEFLVQEALKAWRKKIS